MLGFTYLDYIALSVFIGGWAAYIVLIEWSSISKRSLNLEIDRYRGLWMRQMLSRDVRIVDTHVMGSLQNGTAFFASTSLLAIGGSLTLMRATNEALEVIAALPFGIATTRAAWDLKVMGLAVMFVYAFFKFAWSYRLFNYAAIIIGAVPPPKEQNDPEAVAMADRAGRLITIAGHHFNRGQRAFFFSLAYLGWFLHPWLLMVTTAAAIAVMIHRQYGPEADAVFT